MLLFEIKQKFKTGIYSLWNVPSRIYIENNDVYINNTPINLENFMDNYDSKRCEYTEILKAHSYGDWNFYIAMVHKDFFDSRESFDNQLVSREWREINQYCVSHDFISLQNAFKIMKVYVGVNLDYFLNNKNEIDHEIRENTNFNSNKSIKKLKNKLFYNIMSKLFGINDITTTNAIISDKKEIIIEKFAVLSYDGNSIDATGELGDYYLMFGYATS